MQLHSQARAVIVCTNSVYEVIQLHSITDYKYWSEDSDLQQLGLSSLVPSPTPSFSSLLSDEKLGVGLGTRLGFVYTKYDCHVTSRARTS